MNHNFIILIATLMLFLVSCDCLHERSCDSFYYDTDFWQKVEENDEIKFRANSGQEIIFKLQETILNEPFIASRNGGCPETSNVNCRLTKEHIYTSDDLSLDIKLRFEQIEFGDQPVTQQQVSYSFSIREDKENDYDVLHAFKIAPEYEDINSDKICFRLFDSQ